MNRMNLTALLCFVSSSVFCQVHRIGVSVAPNLTSIQYKSGIRNREQFKIGINAALNYRVDFNSGYFFGADVMFNQRGANVYRSRFYNECGNSLLRVITVEQNYLAIPLKFGINFGRDNQGYFALGMVPSTFLNGKFTFQKLDGSETSRKLEIPKLAVFDFAGLVELGIRAKINNKTSAFSSLQYQHSYASFWEGKRDYYPRHFGLALNFGLLYRMN